MDQVLIKGEVMNILNAMIQIIKDILTSHPIIDIMTIVVAAAMIQITRNILGNLFKRQCIRGRI